jgi:hypothetical protein
VVEDENHEKQQKHTENEDFRKTCVGKDAEFETRYRVFNTRLTQRGMKWRIN